jgi:hypothetical protein
MKENALTDRIQMAKQSIEEETTKMISLATLGSEDERRAVQDVIALEQRFPIGDFASRNRVINRWIGSVSLRVKSKFGKNCNRGSRSPDVAVNIGKIDEWPGMSKVVRLRHDEYNTCNPTMITEIVPDSPLNGLSTYSMKSLRTGNGLIDRSLTGIKVVGFEEAFSSDEPSKVYERFDHDEIHKLMKASVDTFEMFESSGGLLHPVAALKKVFMRSTNAPQTTDSVMKAIMARVEDMESTKSLAMQSILDPDLNPAIASALRNYKM